MHTKQLTKTEEDITTIDNGKVEVSKSNGMDFSYDNNKTFKLGHKGVTEEHSETLERSTVPKAIALVNLIHGILIQLLIILSTPIIATQKKMLLLFITSRKKLPIGTAKIILSSQHWLRRFFSSFMIS